MFSRMKSGDEHRMSIGQGSEILLKKASQEQLKNADLSSTDGAVKIKLKGEFPGCDDGPIDLQVWVFFYFNLFCFEVSSLRIFRKCQP